ncbi:hypothetical protein DID80_05285 [Candidatus Marinamargulisbacteria bacterium SCGC AAA071-K20]|nr:hypothetical protein DID80_05285 [Candidatus Marinamargulisbacteria bacterium SCGC AAA071-K20]
MDLLGPVHLIIQAIILLQQTHLVLVNQQQLVQLRSKKLWLDWVDSARTFLNDSTDVLVSEDLRAALLLDISDQDIRPNMDDLCDTLMSPE